MRSSFLTVLFCFSVFAGCASHRPGADVDRGNPCLVVGPAGVTGAGERHVRVPKPRAPSGPAKQLEMGPVEQFYVASEFPTLITVDCRGEIQPGAASVERGAERRWILRLRDGIRTRVGTVATAEDVVQELKGLISRGAGVDSARVLDDRRFEVFLERPHLEALASLGLAMFSFTNDTHPPDLPIVFDGEEPRDPRDDLARSALYLSDDSDLARYAEDRGMVAFPLPFDRTYVLLAPSRIEACTAGAPPPGLPALVQQDLSSAVRAARVRASETPRWWCDGIRECGPLSPVPEAMIPNAGARESPPVVHYDADDPLARDLAERIVALAVMDTMQSAAAAGLVRALPALRGAGGAPVARGLHVFDLQDRITRGEGFAFVTSIDNPVPDTCGSARELLRRAPWLVARGARLSDAVLPLTDAASFLILTRPDIAATWDVYGTVRIVPTPEVP